MTVAGEFLVCGDHPEPVFLPRSAPRPNAEHPLMPLVEQLLTTIALTVAEYLRETSAFVVLHRLADAAELILRFLAIIALSAPPASAGQTARAAQAHPCHWPRRLALLVAVKSQAKA
ncbi:MAG: hypothetical protein U0821_01105 [Chloroflexota bacterium]